MQEVKSVLPRRDEPLQEGVVTMAGEGISEVWSQSQIAVL